MKHCVSLLLMCGSLLAIQRDAVHGSTSAQTIETNTRDEQKYVRVAAGTFQMGCRSEDEPCIAEEKPAHTVTISKPYWLGQTEVTVRAFKRFAQAESRPMPPEPLFQDRPLNPGWRDETLPITNVSWEEGEAFCEWVGGRLPSEAEWEFAARAGATGGQYDDPMNMAWFASNSGKELLDAGQLWQQDQRNFVSRMFANDNRAHPVGQMRPNAFGLHDMLGNVWEWTHDWYDAVYYLQSPSVDPVGPPSGEHRSIRGGSWSMSPTLMHFYGRGHNNGRNFLRGFRCAR
jgi:formylglycine-generating enzyme required for sulfatase activity